MDDWEEDEDEDFILDFADSTILFICLIILVFIC
jgi:hypothetical protein